MRAEWWSAAFGAAIFVRMALCAVCMHRRSDHFVRLAMLGVLAAGLGLMVTPFYSYLDWPVNLLLAGSVAAYLYADRRSIGACGAACPQDVGRVLDWLDRWRRPLAGLLIAVAVVAMLAVANVRAAETPQAEFVLVPRVQLEQLVALTNQLIEHVKLLKARTGCI